ncbi:MAG: YebC/PmpR family DNA-binding transcriptional regulator [Candidatus Neomarinimicrobiota bacterium]|nr:YebC/PmpR family DNA-binding transcriptional regulator [Candidatus Neomarinimicrobiota bacterium]MEC7935989.1 YebC/PmpR family DNA-binding transcriptional regulator [Candidatus Neomarinimicrobiota bacterium]MEC9026145.1 YebC/PmpR family DNA-binding transcriptional regulator [Candidatus Neomarinimicrobiota bacterium]MEC9105551.1 YebC/PmpR family DNA-binding transcriptional regulator [Candidatus Neomarinimicrobiota bacterium]MED5256275.1 YebC/PmpR family DNA-binding transcriptional regulator [|tara:strand:+ start:1526 stop:2251 length:726 start_codon:yes stop_codon:yes gene_type:complete
MSGHSKWSTIKRKKAAVDAKRGKIFTTLIKEITIAAREAGGDSSSNPRLRQAISSARDANMPQDNIKRAIMKGTGELPGVNYEECSYEAFGPGGVAIFMEVLTDNKNRTVAEVRHLITKYGGNLGENGSVSWMFDKKGQIIISKAGQNEDNLFEDSINAGAEDFDADEDNFIVKTDPLEVMNVRQMLEKDGYKVVSATVEMLPKNLHKIEKEKSEKAIMLLESIEDHEDIKSVYTNLDFED